MLTKEEIRALGPKELLIEVVKAQHELLRKKFSLRSGHSKASHLIKNLRKYIAQLQTIAKEKPKSAGTEDLHLAKKQTIT